MEIVINFNDVHSKSIMVDGLYQGLKKNCKNVGANSKFYAPEWGHSARIRRGPTRIRRHRTKLWRNCDVAQSICELPVYTTDVLFVYLYSPYKDRSAVQKIIASNGMMIVNDKLKLAWMKRDTIPAFSWIWGILSRFKTLSQSNR
jgi:hypothetical protein